MTVQNYQLTFISLEIELAKSKFKTAANKSEFTDLIKKIYEQRLQYFQKG